MQAREIQELVIEFARKSGFGYAEHLETSADPNAWVSRGVRGMERAVRPPLTSPTPQQAIREMKKGLPDWQTMK